MTREQRQRLRSLAQRAAASSGGVAWSLQTSNSFRRIGARGDGDVLCGTVHPRDGHPDLHARVDVLEYVVAAQPDVLEVLLEHIEALETRLVETLGPLPENFDESHHERACLCDVTPCPCPCHTLVLRDGTRGETR